MDISFDRALEGPMVLGDGRFLGLGVMTPVRGREGLFAWRITDGLEVGAEPLKVAGCLRRAVLSRAQAAWGPRTPLPTYITGHQWDGSPANDHRHLAFAFDPARARLLVLDPGERGDERLVRALEGLTELRAGAAGLLRLTPTALDTDDPLLAPAVAWRSVTPYRVNRHIKASSVADAIAADVRASCQALDLPQPLRVDVSKVHTARGVGLEGHVELAFAVAIGGPVLMGRSRHQGGGLFERAA